MNLPITLIPLLNLNAKRSTYDENMNFLTLTKEPGYKLMRLTEFSFKKFNPIGIYIYAREPLFTLDRTTNTTNVNDLFNKICIE